VIVKKRVMREGEIKMEQRIMNLEQKVASLEKEIAELKVQVSIRQTVGVEAIAKDIDAHFCCDLGGN